MTVKLMTEHHLEFISLKGGFKGSSESTLVKMPHCWKSHVTAHIHLHVDYYQFYTEYIRDEYQFNLFDLIMIALSTFDLLQKHWFFLTKLLACYTNNGFSVV